MTSDDSSPLLCARCQVELAPGRGEFYVIRIEAQADPTPPILGVDDMGRDYESEINALVAELHELSPDEALDQVCRRTMHLCMACYAAWIENPAR